MAARGLSVWLVGLCLGQPPAPASADDSAATLQRAAALVRAGELETALPLLRRHVAEHPDHVLIRAHLAELHWKLNQREAAGLQFTRFCADAQAEEELLLPRLVHAHSRLMELAQAAGDAYGERLHRGIGLWYLARQTAAVDADGDGGRLSAEALLIQSAGELTKAHGLRPDEARPCWYLYRVWAGLGQPAPARRWLRRARAAAELLALTPAEREALALSPPSSPSRP
jgi:hypothetical protein